MNELPRGTSENPFLNVETTKLLQELLQSVDGRKIAKKLLQKFSALSQTFEELSESERKIVHEKLNNDFRDQLRALHENLVGDTIKIVETDNYEQFWLILSICTVVLSLSILLCCEIPCDKC